MSFGDSQYHVAECIAVAHAGWVAVAGRFQDSVDFGVGDLKSESTQKLFIKGVVLALLQLRPEFNLHERKSQIVTSPNVKESDETQLQYLHRSISERLMVRDRGLQFYRRRHYAYQSAAVCIAALITILC
jgi:hypothetical protein